jgi:periplasmic protein TonB
LSVYRLPSPYERLPLSRRLSGFGLALAINLALLLVLMTLGIIPPPGQKIADGTVIELIPEGRSPAPSHERREEMHRQTVKASTPTPKPPPIVLPVKPTITPPVRPKEHTSPWVEMSGSEMAAADISKMPAGGSGSEGDSEAVGRGPNGEVLYAAEWARRPTDAEIGGYWPHNTPGWGLVACKTVPENRVEDCVELDQSPRGSHLASAVRQAAWQFRVRPPRKNGRAMIGAWVRILIEIYPSEG